MFFHKYLSCFCVAHSFLDVETLLSVLMHFPTVCSPQPLGQEELEFAVMRIEALKLARQIALASRSRQDTKVPVCRCSALPSGNAVCHGVPRAASLTIGQAGIVGVPL